MPDKVDQRAIGGLCVTRSSSGHLVISPPRVSGQALMRAWVESSAGPGVQLAACLFFEQCHGQQSPIDRAVARQSAAIGAADQIGSVLTPLLSLLVSSRPSASSPAFSLYRPQACWLRTFWLTASLPHPGLLAVPAPGRPRWSRLVPRRRA